MNEMHECGVQEEIEERKFRKAEMELAKAENMIEHEAEIYAKPARTWFQTEKEKTAAAQQREEPQGPPGSKKREREEKRNSDKMKRGDGRSEPSKKAKLMQVGFPTSASALVAALLS